MKNPQQLALHGVLMSIFGTGILITGQSGIGKSEVALSLIDRNHQLVADDMPVFVKKAQQIIGSAQKDYKEFMHLRGVGFINIVKILGPSAVTDSTPLQLVVNIIKENFVSDPFCNDEQNFEILNLKIPQVNISINSSFNLAIVIETVVKNFLLKNNTGYDASSEFEKIQQQHIGNHRS